MKRFAVSFLWFIVLVLLSCSDSAHEIEAGANTKVSLGDQLYVSLEMSANEEYVWQLINPNNKNVLDHIKTEPEIEKTSGQRKEKWYFDAVGTGTDTLTFRLVHLTGPDKKQLKEVVSTKSFVIEVI